MTSGCTSRSSKDRARQANFTVETFWHDELVVVVPSDHPWSTSQSISFSELRPDLSPASGAPARARSWSWPWRAAALTTGI
ncbi:MAG: hypothetical protein ACLSVD_13840 [Eggerthellaceae bacterium]